MRFLSIDTPDRKADGAPTSQERMAELGKSIEEAMKAGTLSRRVPSYPSRRGAGASDAQEEKSR